MKNIDKEEGSLENPYSKNNKMVGAHIHKKAASNDLIWLSPAFLRAKDLDTVMSRVLGLIARWASSNRLSVK